MMKLHVEMNADYYDYKLIIPLFTFDFLVFTIIALFFIIKGFHFFLKFGKKSQLCS